MSKTKCPNIAESNITVYKVLNSDFTSLYYHFQYELNKLYTESRYAGFEIYFKEFECFGFSSGWIHSYTNKKIAEEYIKEGRILVECIIPKGTAYLVDLCCTELCSKGIKITKVL